MNILYSIFANSSYIVTLLWLFLFAFLSTKVFFNQLFSKSKVNKIYNNKLNFDYKKVFYLLLLTFALTQSFSRSDFLNLFNIYTTQTYGVNQFQILLFLQDTISLFTLFSFYLFLFSFFIANKNEEKQRKLKLLSLSIIFINLLLNLWVIPEEFFYILQNGTLSSYQIIDCFILSFIYLFIVRFLIKFFKNSFNFTITELFKLSILVFKIEALKATVVTKNKTTILNFINQTWELYSLLDDNDKIYYLIEDKNFIQKNTVNIDICESNLVKRNQSFLMFAQKTTLQQKTLKDYIFINGWKMSLIQ